MRYGFTDLGLKRIIGLVMPENIASVRVLEKTGLRSTETVTFWGSQFLKIRHKTPEVSGRGCARRRSLPERGASGDSASFKSAFSRLTSEV